MFFQKLLISRSATTMATEQFRSPVVKWCFTSHTATRWWIDGAILAECVYFKVQEELTDTLEPHYQGFFILKKRKSLRQVKALTHIEVHFEAMKGSYADNEHYCSKPIPGCSCDKCVAENGKWLRLNAYDITEHLSILPRTAASRYTFSHGELPADNGHPKRSASYIPTEAEILSGEITLEDIQALSAGIKYRDTYLKIFKQMPRAPKTKFAVVIIHGKSGCGKTSWSRNYLPPPWNESLWFCTAGQDPRFPLDGYRGELVIQFNDNPWILQEHPLFKVICDVTTQRVAVKGSHVNADYNLVVITTNETKVSWMKRLWLDEDDENSRACRRRVHFELYCDRALEPGTPEWIEYYDPKFKKLTEDVLLKIGNAP